MTVPSANGPIRIDNIARIERGLGPTTLQRSNRQFTVSLNADVAPGHALDEAANDVRRMLTGLNMPPTMSFRLQGQSKILDETTANLMMAIGLAMIFVYMVLASQFESFLQPIVIMLVLPIAVPFALFTLWITGSTLNLWSALGMLLLLGIVKKNSILQVDYANVLRARGMPLREAIVESCRTRLRPILMTTTAIIAGLIPTSLGIGIGGTGRAAIALTIIGGQSLCLFLTLLLVPVAYVKFDALERALVGDGARRWLEPGIRRGEGPFPSGSRRRERSGPLPESDAFARLRRPPSEAIPTMRCSCSAVFSTSRSAWRPHPLLLCAGAGAREGSRSAAEGSGRLHCPVQRKGPERLARPARRRRRVQPVCRGEVHARGARGEAQGMERRSRSALECRSPPAASSCPTARGVHLSTEKAYGDFEFLVDWKLTQPNGDSGVYLRRLPAGPDLGSCESARAEERRRQGVGRPVEQQPGQSRAVPTGQGGQPHRPVEHR